MARPPATSTVRCTCRPSRGLACTRCYTPLPPPTLIDPAATAAALVAMCEAGMLEFEEKPNE